MTREVLATFRNEGDITKAAHKATAAGFRIVDAYTPYPLDELRSLFETPSSNLIPVCFSGAVLGVGFQVWANAVSWPLNVGGKPLPAWLGYIPITFEFAVLCAGLATFVAFIVSSRRERGFGGESITFVRNRFVLRMAVEDDVEYVKCRQLLHEAGASVLREHARDQAPSRQAISCMIRKARVRWALLAILVGSSLSSWLLWPDSTRPNFTYAPDMASSPALEPYDVNEAAPNGQAIGVPAPGAIARGLSRLPFAATEADALRAGVELQKPSNIGGQDDVKRGAFLFTHYCQTCHGEEGHGDGITIKRGFQPPPSLLTAHAREMKDGQMFHVLTYGQKLMPSHAGQLDVDDRWRAIVFVRALQMRLPVEPPPFGSAPSTSTNP